MTRATAETHYADLKERPFFGALVDYILSGPVVCMVWEGKDVVKTGRTMIGATNPLASAPGTIRGDFAIDVGRNVIHGSDSVEASPPALSNSALLNRRWMMDNGIGFGCPESSDGILLASSCCCASIRRTPRTRSLCGSPRV